MLDSNLTNLLSVAIPSFFGMVAAIYGMRNGRGIKGVHDLVNSRMTELVKATKKIAKAAGIVEGEKRANGKHKTRRRKRG